MKETTEALDHFKYLALNAKLEGLKGKKKPIHDFIKQIAELSNQFSHTDSSYNKQYKTQRYAFMLATKAITYDGSANRIAVRIRRSIDYAANSIITNPELTTENINETYEHFDGSISMHPSSIEEAYRYDDLTNAIERTSRIYLYSSSLRQGKSFSNPKAFHYYLLHTRNPDSASLPLVSRCSQQVMDECKEEMIAQHELLANLIKKDTPSIS